MEGVEFISIRDPVWLGEFGTRSNRIELNNPAFVWRKPVYANLLICIALIIRITERHYDGN
jgi:hypothetical protein